MDDKPSFTCRMYEEKYPEVDEVVMVQVKSIAEMGAYVSLLEYNNIDGMILLSELSRRRIRSVNKLIKVGVRFPAPPPPPPPDTARSSPGFDGVCVKDDEN